MTVKLNPAEHPFSIDRRSANDNRKPLGAVRRSITPPALMIHRRPAESDAPPPTAAADGLAPPLRAVQNPRRTSRETLTPDVTSHHHHHLRCCDDRTNPPYARSE